MGILDDAQTASGIANEWEPYNATLLQSMDVLVYALITDPQWKLPQLAPDGNYCPNATSISEKNTNKQLCGIINVLGQRTIVKNNSPIFYIYDDGTVEKRIVIE